MRKIEPLTPHEQAVFRQWYEQAHARSLVGSYRRAIRKPQAWLSAARWYSKLETLVEFARHASRWLAIYALQREDAIHTIVKTAEVAAANCWKSAEDACKLDTNSRVAAYTEVARYWSSADTVSVVQATAYSKAAWHLANDKSQTGLKDSNKDSGLHQAGLEAARIAAYENKVVNKAMEDAANATNRACQAIESAATRATVIYGKAFTLEAARLIGDSYAEIISIADAEYEEFEILRNEHSLIQSDLSNILATYRAAQDKTMTIKGQGLKNAFGATSHDYNQSMHEMEIAANASASLYIKALTQPDARILSDEARALTKDIANSATAESTIDEIYNEAKADFDISLSELLANPTHIEAKSVYDKIKTMDNTISKPVLDESSYTQEIYEQAEATYRKVLSELLANPTCVRTQDSYDQAREDYDIKIAYLVGLDHVHAQRSYNEVVAQSEHKARIAYRKVRSAYDGALSSLNQARDDQSDARFSSEAQAALAGNSDEADSDQLHSREPEYFADSAVRNYRAYQNLSSAQFMAHQYPYTASNKTEAAISYTAAYMKLEAVRNVEQIAELCRKRADILGFGLR